MKSLIVNGKKIVGLAVARRNCRGGMFVHGGGQHGRRKLLWQFTVAIKSDPVAPDMKSAIFGMCLLHRCPQ